MMIFGECQALLYNFENELIKLFGHEYALNEAWHIPCNFRESEQENRLKLINNYFLQR